MQGSSLHALGTVALPLSLAKNSQPFESKFFVSSDFTLNSDGLLGLDSLVTHGIDVFLNIMLFHIRILLSLQWTFRRRS